MRAGFTLIEIILVLGLIAFAAAIVVTNFVAMIDRDGEPNPEERLRTAVREARFLAGSERREASLRYDDETGELVISTGEGGEERRIPMGENFADRGRAEIRFFLVPSAEGLSPLPEAADSRLRTGVIRFAPDRSSSPFVAEIDEGSGTPERLVFDPFSNLVKSTKNP